MYSLVTKLKSVKSVIKSLSRKKYWNIFERVKEARNRLEEELSTP